MGTIPPVIRPDFGWVKVAIHRKLIQKLDLARVTQLGREAVRGEVAKIVENLAAEENTPKTFQERERLSQEVLDEVLGLGPLEPLVHQARRRGAVVGESLTKADACPAQY